MAEGDDDAFFAALENNCKIIESAILSKCNMNQQTREEARQALACKESLKDAMSSLPKKTYSSVVALSFGGELNEPSRKTSCCSILIAAENCNSDDVRKLFKAQINPRKEKIGIRQFKKISENRILVNRAFEKDRDKLMTAIEANSKFLKPTVPKRKSPTMLIRNVPNDVDDSELPDDIREQNPEILDSNECWNESRVRFVLKKFQHVRTVVIKFHPKIRKSVNAVGLLKIMWNMCRIEDFLVINRCFSCFGYNHRANECTNSLSCYFCAGEHKNDNCSNCENQVCVNCIRYNKKLKNEAKKVVVKHKAFSPNWSCHNYMRNKVAARTDYD
ncbi:gag-like protein [Trichonephila inaurata madagascariensis]|uniref:Gag-like protein n=1 Tax=Trichonephila inaurata madagascariensis TaxID=2747483 RepID=A0A8X6Y207_9ARAC|nr:gag-like protein [Trichonephila inaurata madagascariensis]